MASDEGDTEFQIRIKRVVKELGEKGVKQVDIAKAANVSKAMPTHWIKGSVVSMSLEQAVGIWRAYGYSPMWLVLGELPVMLPTKGSPVNAEGIYGIWPFPDVDPELVSTLPLEQRLQLQGALIGAAAALGIPLSKPPKNPGTALKSTISSRASARRAAA